MGLRCFLAVDLPAFIQTNIANLITQLSGNVPAGTVRWVAAEQAHLTLHFLGNDASSHAVEELRQRGRTLTSDVPPADLQLSRWGTFPPHGLARVVYLACRGPGVGTLQLLHRRFGDLLRQLKVPVDPRPYHPHVTIGRCRQATTIRPEVIVIPPAPFTAATATLYRSTLTPSGPIYEPLERFTLNGAPT